MESGSVVLACVWMAQLFETKLNNENWKIGLGRRSEHPSGSGGGLGSKNPRRNLWVQKTWGQGNWSIKVVLRPRETWGQGSGVCNDETIDVL